ncbi:protein of unknown function (plasmid) [Azospirillum lipoferum 4B]|uniref:Uncharacterized protein n=1 Tax=Azospirillum lipoferum (strain 4B) TaxID=862719 RepID=G7ZI67_AZOL4|nr:protein of unknown function [Azospirillum lipoferum 4B]
MGFAAAGSAGDDVIDPQKAVPGTRRGDDAGHAAPRQAQVGVVDPRRFEIEKHGLFTSLPAGGHGFPIARPSFGKSGEWRFGLRKLPMRVPPLCAEMRKAVGRSAGHCLSIPRR